MEPLEFEDLPDQAVVLMDSAPIVYVLEGHPKFAPRFKPLFEAHARERLRFAVTTITICEVMMGHCRRAMRPLPGATVQSWNHGNLLRSILILRKVLQGCEPLSA